MMSCSEFDYFPGFGLEGESADNNNWNHYWEAVQELNFVKMSMVIAFIYESKIASKAYSRIASQDIKYLEPELILK